MPAYQPKEQQDGSRLILRFRVCGELFRSDKTQSPGGFGTGCAEVPLLLHSQHKFLHSEKGRDPGEPEEEADSCPNKQLKEEFGVVSSLLVQVVATTGGPYGEKLGEELDESSELFAVGKKREWQVEPRQKWTEIDFAVALLQTTKVKLAHWGYFVEVPKLLRSRRQGYSLLDMGASSSCPIFLALNELLRAKNLKIKDSTLQRFLRECDQVAPWFAVSGSLTVSSWEKLGQDLDFAAEQGTLRPGVKPVWRLVRGCLEDQHCSSALECGQAALEQLQEELSEKAELEKTAPEKATKDRGRKGNTERLYPSLSDIEDSDGKSTDSAISEMDSLIQGMHRARIRDKPKASKCLAVSSVKQEPEGPFCLAKFSGHLPMGPACSVDTTFCQAVQVQCVWFHVEVFDLFGVQLEIGNGDISKSSDIIQNVLAFMGIVEYFKFFKLYIWDLDIAALALSYAVFLAPEQLLTDCTEGSDTLSARQQRWTLHFISSPPKVRRKRSCRWQKPIYTDTKQVVF
ncbi:hypothetical protein STEG23_007511 [Scotinomys teguina]